MEMTYLWPSSWVMVCANVMPLSSFTLHERSGLHIPPTFATPSVLFLFVHDKKQITRKKEYMYTNITYIQTLNWIGTDVFGHYFLNVCIVKYK